MPSLNKVLLMGNLTRDPQIKYLANQTAVAEFGLACNRKWRTPAGEEKEDVAFVDCTAFGKQAETLNTYCTKGKPLFVEGRLKFDTWDDKNGGGKRSKLTVVVENFQFLGGRDDAGGEGGGQAPARQPQRQQSRGGDGNVGPTGQRRGPDEPFGEEKQFKEDDIPF